LVALLYDKVMAIAKAMMQKSLGATIVPSKANIQCRALSSGKIHAYSKRCDRKTPEFIVSRCLATVKFMLYSE